MAQLFPSIYHILHENLGDLSGCHTLDVEFCVLLTWPCHPSGRQQADWRYTLFGTESKLHVLVWTMFTTEASSFRLSLKWKRLVIVWNILKSACCKPLTLFYSVSLSHTFTHTHWLPSESALQNRLCLFGSVQPVKSTCHEVLSDTHKWTHLICGGAASAF